MKCFHPRWSMPFIIRLLSPKLYSRMLVAEIWSLHICHVHTYKFIRNSSVQLSEVLQLWPSKDIHALWPTDRLYVISINNYLHVMVFYKLTYFVEESMLMPVYVVGLETVDKHILFSDWSPVNSQTTALSKFVRR